MATLRKIALLRILSPKGRIPELTDLQPGEIVFNDVNGIFVRGRVLTDKLVNINPGSSSETQNIGDIDGLQGELDGKAPLEHNHVMSHVSMLSNTLATKARVDHTHDHSQISDFASALNNKSDIEHTHTTADISNLAATLDGYAATTHTHSQDAVTGLEDAITNKSPAVHTHTITTEIQTELDKKAVTGHTHPASMFANSGLGTTGTKSIKYPMRLMPFPEPMTGKAYSTVLLIDGLLALFKAGTNTKLSMVDFNGNYRLTDFQIGGNSTNVPAVADGSRFYFIDDYLRAGAALPGATPGSSTGGVTKLGYTPYRMTRIQGKDPTIRVAGISYISPSNPVDPVYSLTPGSYAFGQVIQLEVAGAIQANATAPATAAGLLISSGTNLYYLPARHPSVSNGLHRFDLSQTSMPVDTVLTLTNFPLATLGHHTQGVMVNNVIYAAPDRDVYLSQTYADSYLLAMNTVTGSYESINIASISSSASFQDVLTDRRYIYYIPNRTGVPLVRYDTSKPFVLGNLETLDLSSFGTTWTGIVVRKHLYLIPRATGTGMVLPLYL